MIKPINNGDVISTPFVVSDSVVGTSRRNDYSIVLETDVVYTTYFEYESGTYTNSTLPIYILSEDGVNYIMPEHYLSDVLVENPLLTLDHTDYGDGEWSQITSPVTHVSENDDTEISNNIKNGKAVIK